MSSPKKVLTEENMKPDVYEEGSNIGPDIEYALDCEHLDADLFRSKNVRAQLMAVFVPDRCPCSRFGDPTVLGEYLVAR